MVASAVSSSREKLDRIQNPSADGETEADQRGREQRAAEQSGPRIHLVAIHDDLSAERAGQDAERDDGQHQRETAVFFFGKHSRQHEVGDREGAAAQRQRDSGAQGGRSPGRANHADTGQE